MRTQNYIIPLKLLVKISAAALILLGLQGCLFGGDDHGHDHSGHDHPSLTADGDTVTSTNGHFSAIVDYDNGALSIQETNTVMLTILDMSGNTLTGATLTVKPWMPGHGHGSPTDPMVHDMGMGMYHIMKINIHMDGSWELQVNVESGGMSDLITVKFDVSP